MANQHRTELQQEVVDALIESSAINFEAIGGIFAKFGERAARTGTELGFVVGRRVLNYCIPPDPFRQVERPAALQERG
jgi:hypothetical protein